MQERKYANKSGFLRYQSLSFTLVFMVAKLQYLQQRRREGNSSRSAVGRRRADALARPAKADERPSKSATEGAKGDAVSVVVSSRANAFPPQRFVQQKKEKLNFKFKLFFARQP